ncbi:MAG: hypothetical protein IKY65_04395 [Rikenellaceae bacterium]|nr:hypothetical protein [Rikenellaceae bacterium]
MIKFPFTSLQQLNLDWIMQQLHKILDFMPLNGVAGDVLQRTVDGAAWQPIAAISMDIHSLNSTTPDPADEIPIYDNDLVGNYKTTVQDVLDLAPVQSVNGQTGDVVLSIPTVPVTSVNGQTGDVVLSIPTQTSDLVNDSNFITASGAPVQSVCSKVGSVLLDKTDIGLANVENVQQYSASNPPPYPVTSVNGQTGDVIVSGGGGSPTLLWTNSDPASAFAEQTVPLDLSDYSFVMIEYAANMMFDMQTAIFPVTSFSVPPGYTGHYQMVGLNSSGSDITISRRHCTISSTGIYFAWGTYLATYAANSLSTSDQVCRPLRIWGIE